MQKEVSKVIVFVVMLVTFIGQVMAASTAMPCELLPDPLSSIENTQISTKNFSNAIINDRLQAENKEECCDIECCTISCLCTANGCSPFAYLNSCLGGANAVVFEEVVLLLPPEPTTSASSLLYRPPIITS